MGKAVLISIRPEWCEKIVNGAKTIEVRKSRPKLEPPFKCYIYCTYGKGLIERYDQCHPNRLLSQKVDKRHIWGNCCNGKVIGEFVCDRIYQYTTTNCIEGADISTEDMTKGSCLAEQELHAYEYSAEPKENCIYLVGLYGWHISDLVIYDAPKELGEFNGWTKIRFGVRHDPITRPPQSWCYVEEVDND